MKSIVFHERLLISGCRSFRHALRLLLVLTMGGIFSAAANGRAQTVTLSVSNMPLSKVCQEIEKQTGYYFVYAKDFDKNGHLVTVKVSGASLEMALHKVFDGLPFSWKIIDKVVVVNTAEAQTPKIAEEKKETVEAPGIDISGVVLNEQGQPLAGANVTVKTTGKGVYTNAKGEFKLKGVESNSELIVSFVGLTPKTVVANKDGFVQVRLLTTENELDKAVVKGYYKTTNRINTGDVTSVKAEDIQRQPVTDPILTLEGKVAGLNVTQTSGLAGSNSVIQLRGQNFITSDGRTPPNFNAPYFVVDGVPFNSLPLNQLPAGAIGSASQSNPGAGLSPFNYLDPSDIESIDVLKDADATSIYGSRGANGVILITTKHGKIGRTKLDLNVSSGYGKLPKKIEMLNTKEYLQLRREAVMNDGNTALLSDPNNYIYFPDLTIWDTTRFTDWQELLSNNKAYWTNIHAGLSGGNANFQYLMGGGYGQQGNLVPGHYADKKGMFFLNLFNSSADGRFRVQFSGNYTHDNNNLPGVNFSSLITLPPDAPPVYDSKGNLNWAVYDGTATWSNPFASTAIYSRALTDNLIANADLSYLIFTGLQIKTSVGYNQTYMRQNTIYPSTSVQPPYNTDPGARSNNFGNSNQSGWIIEPQVSYETRINSCLLSILSGVTFQNSNSNSLAEFTSGYSSDALIMDPNSASTIAMAGSSFVQYRYDAVYGRASLNFDNKYIVNFTARRDGSSRFGPGKQFGNFGSVGAAWIFSKENGFNKTLPFVSFGKLRGSYGIAGSDAIADYAYLSSYQSTGVNYQGIVGLSPVRMPNPYYQWGSVKKIEAALELGFWHDRLLTNFVIYRNRTQNQVVSYPLPFLTGFSSVIENLPAVIQNSGIEITLTSKNIKTKDFSWSTSLNLSLPSNKLVSFPGIGKSPFANVYEVGRSVYSQNLYHYQGVNPMNGLYTFASAKGPGSTSLLQVLDKRWSKPITADFFGGIQNNFSYKGLSLDIFFQFSHGNGYSFIKYMQLPGDMYNIPRQLLSRWQKPGDISNTQMLSAWGANNTLSAYGYVKNSDGAVADNSFVRLKNVSLSYSLPVSLVRSYKMEQLRFYLQCQNIMTFTKYFGLDPESGSLNMPPLRMMTAGIQITF